MTAPLRLLVVTPAARPLDDALVVARSTGDDLDLVIEALVGRTVDDVERALILKTLERCRGNRTSASLILGISVRTMRNKLKSFLDSGAFIAPPGR